MLPFQSKVFDPSSLTSPPNSPTQSSSKKINGKNIVAEKEEEIEVPSHLGFILDESKWDAFSENSRVKKPTFSEVVVRPQRQKESPPPKKEEVFEEPPPPPKTKLWQLSKITCKAYRPRLVTMEKPIPLNDLTDVVPNQVWNNGKFCHRLIVKAYV